MKCRAPAAFANDFVRKSEIVARSRWPYSALINQVSGIYRNGAVVPDEPVDWPEGLHVKIVCESSARSASASTGRVDFSAERARQFDPIPLRPPGYFQFDREDPELDKKFSTANVVPKPDRE